MRLNTDLISYFQEIPESSLEESPTKSNVSSTSNNSSRKSRQEMYQDLEDLKEFNADIQFRLNEVFNGDGESRSTPQQDLGLAICANMMGFNRAKMRRSHGQFLFFILQD